MVNKRRKEDLIGFEYCTVVYVTQKSSTFHGFAPCTIGLLKALAFKLTVACVQAIQKSLNF